MNCYRRFWSQASEELPQSLDRHRDTAGSRRQFRPGHVDEHGAAAARNAGPLVVVDLDDEVVQGVRAPQSVSRLTGRNSDRPVVAPVGRVFAPSVQTSDRAHRQQRPRSREAVRTPPQSDQPIAPRWRRAVSFPLVGLDTGTAKRHFGVPAAGRQPALPAIPRPCPQAQICQRCPMHMIFNQTEFGHIAIAMQWPLRFSRRLLYLPKTRQPIPTLRLPYGDCAQNSDR
jgi:hypothetical protein